MAMLRFGSASVAKAEISTETWTKRICSGNKQEDSRRVKVAKNVFAKYTPEKYLLSHCTIIAAVETELADPSNPNSDYYIHPSFSKYVNNNGDAWSKQMLASCYRSFVGSHNYLEHIQIPELSKGRVIDAILREVPVGVDKTGKELSTYYVDILVATERKHRKLIADIQSGKLNSLSMGCFIAGTEITMADGTKRGIEEIKPGDMVITHTGKVKPVMHIQKRWHSGSVHAIKVEGDYKTTVVTPEHPFWAFNKERTCACGCGEKLNVKIRADNSMNSGLSYAPFKRGHYSKIVNPNKNIYSMNQYRLLKESNPSQEKISLSWVNAKDLKVGDLVSYPKSEVIIKSDDATIEKARLIGYFLAEGSFVKEVVVKGEENEYGIRCRICGNLYNKIGPHLSTHKINQKEYLELYPEAPTEAKINKQLIRTKSRKDEIDIQGFIKTRKKVGVEFSLGIHEKDTVNKEIEELSKKVFPNATVLCYDNRVKIIGEEPALFFEKYGGEYFDHKKLPQEVLYWEPEIQRHLVATWIIGDLNTTGSKDLASQLRFMLNRLYVIHNHFKVKENLYQTDLKRTATDGTVITQHYEGTRSEAHMIQINFQGYDRLNHELNHAFKFRIPPKYRNVSNWGKNIVKRNWKNNHNLGSIVRPIRSIEDKYYEGWVYNFSVEGDESYIANDVAVHNCKIAFSICTKCGNRAVDETQACQHVRFEKNNIFYDDSGNERKVAELCGHESEPESVTFIDASWVKAPAFTGAVIRNIINPPENILAKIEEANKKESYLVQEDDFLKAAHVAYKTSAEGDEPEPPAEEPPAEEPPAEEPPAEDAPAEDAPAEDAPAEDAPAEDAPPEVPGMEEDQNSVKTWKDEVKKKVLQELGNELVEEMSGEDSNGSPRELETLDDSLIHPTASQALQRMWVLKEGWDKFLKETTSGLSKEKYNRLKFGSFIMLNSDDPKILADYGYKRRDFLAVMSYLDRCFKNPLPMNIKRAVAKLNGTKGLSLDEAVFSLQKLAGKKLAENEIRKSLVWLKLMDLYQE